MASEAKQADAPRDDPAVVDAEEVSRINKPVSECRVHTVTVFRDRAEVTREVRLTAPGGSANLIEVVVAGLTERIDCDSVRVKGSGRFRIEEVSFATNTVVDEPDAARSADATDSGVAADPAALREELLKAEDRIRDFEQERKVIQARQSLLDGYAKSVLHPSAPHAAPAAVGAAAGAPVGLPPVDTDFVLNLLDTYATRSTAANEALNAIVDKERAANKECDAIRERIRLAGLKSKKTTRRSNDVTVMLKPLWVPTPSAPPADGDSDFVDVGDARDGKVAEDDGGDAARGFDKKDFVPEDSRAASGTAGAPGAAGAGAAGADAEHEIVVYLSYMVSNASWTPSYDIRVSSKDESMGLSYFGRVTQNTGEDWTRARVVLSTAAPAVGGSAPMLGSLHVRFAVPQFHTRRADKSSGFGSSSRSMALGGSSLESASLSITSELNAQAEMLDSVLSRGGKLDGLVSQFGTAAPVATASVSSSSGGSAATFTIERLTTIKSDNKPHKVTVAIIELRSRFRHFSAPSRNAAAYLQAMTTNTSEYTLLASDNVAIFLDGSFVSKSSLRTVSPGESFRSFLGVDPGVRITYRPVSAIRAQHGVWNKSESTTYEHVTVVHNTKDRPITIVVAGCLPRSSDERIKVKSIEPTEEELDEGSRLEELLTASDPASIAGADAESGAMIEDGADSAGAGAGSDGGYGDSAAAAAAEDRVARNTMTNNIVWRRTVAPRESRRIRYRYSIEHPRGQPVETY